MLVVDRGNAAKLDVRRGGKEEDVKGDWEKRGAHDVPTTVVVLKRAEKRTSVCVPYAQRAVSGHGDDVAIGDGHSIHRGAVRVQDVLRPQVGEEVRPDRAICKNVSAGSTLHVDAVKRTLGARHESLVIEAHAEHAVLMILDDLYRSVRREVPYNHAAIAACARQQPVVHTDAQH